MTTTKSAGDTEWFDINQRQWQDWFENQRKAVDAHLGQTGGMQNQWDAQWKTLAKSWQAFSTTGKDTPAAGDFGQFFAQAGEGFVQFMQQFQGTDGYPRSSEDSIRNWTLTMQKFFEGIIHAQSKSDDPTAQYRAFTENLISLGPAVWMSFSKNPFAQHLADPNTAAMFDAQAKMHDPLGYFAAMPGIGHTREKQEDLGKLYRLWTDHEAASRRYNAEMTKIGLISLNRFQEYLKTPPADAKPITSMKDIYAKWIDACEEVYGHYAMTDEYTEIYGKAVNTLMRFRQKLNDMIDETAGQMNMPTRKEVDSLHERMHAMRRENLKMKKMMEELLAQKTKGAKE